MKAWIGVDFDGTLAIYDKWHGPTHVGAPIPKMVERVKAWLAEGKEVRIFTARIFPLMTVKPNDNLDMFEVNSDHPISAHCEAIEAVIAIQHWCKEHLGKVLTVTCVKDYGLVTLYDDRAVQIIANTGMTVREALGLKEE